MGLRFEILAHPRRPQTAGMNPGTRNSRSRLGSALGKPWEGSAAGVLGIDFALEIQRCREFASTIHVCMHAMHAYICMYPCINNILHTQQVTISRSGAPLLKPSGLER